MARAVQRVRLHLYRLVRMISGSKTIATASGTFTITMTTNTGTGNLIMSSEVLTTGTQFQITANTCLETSTVAPAGTCTVAVKFAPTLIAGPGYFNDTLPDISYEQRESDNTDGNAHRE